MKRENRICIILVLFCTVSRAHAVTGREGGNGGDVQCDALIKNISANIQGWIGGDGPAIGQLDLSSSLNPISKTAYTYLGYDASMLSLLALPLNSSCVILGDPGYPVTVDGSAKICKTSVDEAGVHMLCDRQQFLGLNADQQIEQIHHEFATNIPELEPDNGPISSYKISDQLSAFIENVQERKLVVQSPPHPSGTGLGSMPSGTWTAIYTIWKVDVDATDNTASFDLTGVMKDSMIDLVEQFPSAIKWNPLCGWDTVMGDDGTVSCIPSFVVNCAGAAWVKADMVIEHFSGSYNIADIGEYPSDNEPLQECSIKFVGTSFPLFSDAAWKAYVTASGDNVILEQNVPTGNHQNDEMLSATSTP